MVRERTPARKQLKPLVSDSWVVESDGDDEYTPPPVMSGSRQDDFIRQSRRSAEPAETPRKGSSRHTRSSTTESDFIMPSRPNGNMNGSFHGEKPQQELRQQPKPKRKHSPPPVYRDDGFPRRRPTQLTLQDRAGNLFDLAVDFLQPIFRWMFDIMGSAFQYLKGPLSALLALYVLFGLLLFLRNLLFNSVSSALSPICRVPGVRFINLGICHSSFPVEYDGDDAPPVRFDELMGVQNKFEEILREAAGGVSLPLDMKRGETGIRDLRQVVRFSQLHSRNELGLEFDGFIETARIASYDLQRFNSHVGRGVDNILATARWTKRVLDGIAERDAGRGAIAGFFGDKVLKPFQPIKFTEDMLLDQYIQHTRKVEEEVFRLIEEAQALLMLLQNLEDRLDVIHGIAIRDDLHAKASKDEVLSQLWTMLGGNRRKLGKFDSQLKLLDQVNTYRQNAIAHVSGTLVKLQGMGTELEELRERVGGVELLDGQGVVPLRMHIENIEMGVERLEKGRKSAKELENEELSESLGRRSDNRKMMIDEK
ncbi:uncharacterized protein KY384_001570 [Bacidia gigantensis]|uniref:uncharacterized protein n=1 Tax=Bacidia gigantensis TaxID=2732470 RepID=UPI001D043542|nr:uncharacterized protein KY384_001570 [Bacidia gigantensis]KAG8533829.1 hypothetical protein KY384_001570 [Bacidia gigantensis]